MKHCKIILGVVFVATALLVVGLTATEQVSVNNPKGLTLSGVSSKNMGAPASSLTAIAEKVEFRNSVSGVTEGEARQGGDNIASATVIASMPYTDNGTVVGYTDDYEEDCAGEGAQAWPDVVYQYTAPDSGLLNVASCNSSYFTRLWLYRSNEDTLVACNRFHSSCGTPPRAALVDILLDSNATYYIVVDGDDLLGDSPGAYEIECTFTPFIDLADSTLLHPAIGDNGQGGMLMAWEESATDTGLFWWGSIDDGNNFSGASWTGIYHYPAISYWGEDAIFYGTAVPDAAQSSGAPIPLITFPDPSNTGSWSFSTWNFGSYGWHDMKDADIGCESTQEFPGHPGEFRAGIISFVQSTTYQDGVTNGPHLFYQTDSSSIGTISWYWLDDCNSTSIDIDRASKLYYAIYDYYDPDSSQWQLFTRRELFGDPDDEIYTQAFSHALDDNADHVMYPDVAAYDSNVIILTETYNDASPNDRDILCWYNPNSDGSIATLETSVVAGTTDDERFPRVVHVDGTIFAAIYTKGDTLMGVTTLDAGATWGAPMAISLVPDDEVVSEYKNAALSEYGLKAIWEYRNAGDPDTSIFVHFSDVLFDSDGDTVPDADDNCPSSPNAGQENDDIDSHGNVCDNCPTVTNEDQADTDGDGNGDACDICAGYDDNLDADGDTVPDGCDICPGFDDLADSDSDTVPDSCDNCPDTPNTDQTDTDEDGIGDACAYICGDANGDSSVNIGDAVYIIAYIFNGGPAPDPEAAGEVNCDGSVNIGDAVYMINYIFRGGAAPCDCTP
ncbi:MAG: thrombospondin type 3 repeat-containing protein [Candidatus Zixiibacteriota bacterium]